MTEASTTRRFWIPLTLKNWKKCIISNCLNIYCTCEFQTRFKLIYHLFYNRIMHIKIIPNYPTSKNLHDHSEIMLKFASILIYFLRYMQHGSLYHTLWKNIPKFWVYHSCGVIFGPHSARRCGMVNCVCVVPYPTNPILV